MDVKAISVVAIKPSVDSGSRDRRREREDSDSGGDEQHAQAGAQFADHLPGGATDNLTADAPDLAPELPAAPRPGRYVNKVV